MVTGVVIVGVIVVGMVAIIGIGAGAVMVIVGT